MAISNASLFIGLGDVAKKRQAHSRMRIVTIFDVRYYRCRKQKFTNHCVKGIITRDREGWLKVY